MSDANEFVDANGQPLDGGALRKQLEKALADLKAEREKNTELAKKDAERTKVELFTKHKLHPKLAKLYTGELTDEAVKTFGAEYADVFGAPADADSDKPADQTANNDTANGTTDPQVLQAQALFQKAAGAVGSSDGSTVFTPNVAQSRVAELVARPDATQADVEALLTQMGFKK